MESITDLLGRKRVLLPKGRVLSERAGLVDWFSKKYQRNWKYTGVRIAHFSVDHLYVIQSEYKDIQRRRGDLAAIKYLWAATKTTKV